MQPAVVEECGATIGMAEIDRDLRHARQHFLSLSPNRMVPQHLIALEQVGKDLAVVGGRALVVAAVRQHLLAELLLKVFHSQGAPAPRLDSIKECARPQQRLHVLDQVVAEDVGLEVADQEADLLRERRPRPPIRMPTAGGCRGGRAAASRRRSESEGRTSSSCRANSHADRVGWIGSSHERWRPESSSARPSRNSI